MSVNVDFVRRKEAELAALESRIALLEGEKLPRPAATEVRQQRQERINFLLDEMLLLPPRLPAASAAGSVRSCGRTPGAGSLATPASAASSLGRSPATEALMSAKGYSVARVPSSLHGNYTSGVASPRAPSSGVHLKPGRQCSRTPSSTPKLPPQKMAQGAAALLANMHSTPYASRTNRMLATMGKPQPL